MEVDLKTFHATENRADHALLKKIHAGKGQAPRVLANIEASM